MPAEYKLLDVLRTIKEELGTLSTAWFTTYALDPLIVENYLLAELLEQERPKDIYDYEALTARYAESDTDIRFFYDPDALITTNQKRTSIPFFPAAASGFGSRFDGGVFHPKIWYLRSVPDEKGKSRAMLLVTSANLSISGWAENREAFLLREVTEGENASRLRDFFRFCFRASGLDAAEVDLAFEELMTEKERIGGKPEWKFVYNAPEKREMFLDALFSSDGIEGEYSDEKNTAKLLAVWSPYWAQDIPALVEHLREKAGGNLKLELYPDFVGKEQPRFSNEQLRIMREGGGVDYFYRDPVSADPERFSHAKVWLTSEAFAVGSWNCTHTALDLGAGENTVDGAYERSPSNVEAGIVVYTVEAGKQPKRPDNAEQIDIASLEAAPVEDTEEETMIRGAMPPLRIFFDWQERRYELQWDETSAFNPDKWRIRLPGLCGDHSVKDLIGEGPALLPNQANELIASRLCILWRTDDAYTPFYLYVVESGIKGNYRPSLRYRDLDELFRHLQAHTSTANIGDSGGGTLNVPSGSAHSVDESAFEEETLREGGDVASSYFVLFRAFHNKGEEIKSAKDRSELRMCAEIAPGNLFEIWEHICSVIYDEDEGKKKLIKRLYTYFLLREYRSLIDRFFMRVDTLIGNTVGEVAGETERSISSKESGTEKWLSELSRLGERADELREEVEKYITLQITDARERKAMLEMIDEVYEEDYVGEA